MQKTYSGNTRADAIRRIFTEGVAAYAKESGAPMGQALAELAQENPDLWQEYMANVVPIQGDPSPERASSTLAAEMNAGRTRMEALERIFTVEVQRYAEERGLPPSQALAEFIKANPELWEEYREQVRALPRRTCSEPPQSRLATEVSAFAKEHGCSVSVALCEITKARPDLWRAYSEAVMTPSESERIVIPLGDWK